MLCKTYFTWFECWIWIFLQEKLKYAIHFCKSIDTDDYARVALTSDVLVDDTPEASEDSDMELIESDGEIVESEEEEEEWHEHVSN